MVYTYYYHPTRNTEVIVYFNGSVGAGNNKYTAERKDSGDKRQFNTFKEANEYLVQKQGYICWRSLRTI